MKETNFCPICNKHMLYDCAFSPSWGDYDKRICKNKDHILIISSIPGEVLKNELYYNGYIFSWNFRDEKLSIAKINDRNSLLMYEKNKKFTCKDFIHPNFSNPNFLNKLELMVSFN